MEKERKMQIDSDKYLQVGAITSTHGIKGEVKVFPTTDDASRYDDLKEVFLDTGKELMPLHITGVKYFKQYVIVKFREFKDINEIEPYKGKNIYVDREHAVDLEDDEYFVADLLGLKVVTDEGEDFGVLTDVLFTKANDVYTIKRNDDSEVLIPAIEECVLDIDLDEEVMTIHVMPGLLD